jgi:hypothetical protein
LNADAEKLRFFLRDAPIRTMLGCIQARRNTLQVLA